VLHSVDFTQAFDSINYRDRMFSPLMHIEYNTKRNHHPFVFT